MGLVVCLVSSFSRALELGIIRAVALVLIATRRVFQVTLIDASLEDLGFGWMIFWREILNLPLVPAADYVSSFEASFDCASVALSLFVGPSMLIIDLPAGLCPR